MMRSIITRHNKNYTFKSIATTTTTCNFSSSTSDDEKKRRNRNKNNNNEPLIKMKINDNNKNLKKPNVTTTQTQQKKSRFPQIFHAGLTSFLGIGGLTGIAYALNLYTGNEGDYTLLLGSFGATAVLLYAAPKAAFSKPRNVIVGHFLSAVIGITLHKYGYLQADIPLEIIAPLAVSTSIMAMKVTESVHPPAGGTALICVLGSPMIHAYEYQLLMPLFLASSFLCGSAHLLHKVANVKYP